MTFPSKSYRLSHSSLKALHVCERMYQLDRLLVGANTEKQDYPATVLGKAYGAGVQAYLITKDINAAIFALWTYYSPNLEDDIRTQEVAINLLESSVPAMDLLLQDWEILTIKGKPAVEMGFRLNIDENYHYVGYIDAVMQNRWTGKVAVFDVKSTSLRLFDLSPVYQNSPQCLAYSLVIDTIVGEEKSEYDVYYFVGQLGSGNGFTPTIRNYSFPKNLQDRLHFLITLGMDVAHLKEMAAYNIYPQRGDSCLQYNRPCKHFGVCNLFTLDTNLERSEDEVEIVYDFTYQLDEVITNHLARITKPTPTNDTNAITQTQEN